MRARPHHCPMGRVALALALALAVCGAAVGSASAVVTRNTRAEATGVTDDEVHVVALVADLDGLRSKGIPLPPKLTTANSLKRWQAAADAAGPIHGRKIVVTAAVFDPTDVTTYDKACAQATQDASPFVVVNGTGFRQSSVGCITVDHDTPFLYGDAAYAALQEASGTNLVSLGVPAEVSGTTTADIARSEGLVPKSARIGILTSNDPAAAAAGDALAKRLGSRGYDVAQTVAINTLQADVSAINRESTAAVATFETAGVDTVFSLLQMAASQGFFQEVRKTGADYSMFLVDVAASVCTQFGASRIPAEAADIPCVTTWDTRALPTADGIKADTPFEAECRTAFDAAFDQRSQPGVPAGDVTVNGTTYTEDLAPNECTMMALLASALRKAGKSPTWDKVHRSLLKTTDAPAAYMSDGRGGFGPAKPYFARSVHLMTLRIANASTPPDANGLFNGCPAPVNCWVPQAVDGQEWFPVKASR